LHAKKIDGKIKFSLVSTENGKDIGNAICTLKELKEGNVRLSTGGKTSLFVDEFSVFKRPTFL